MVEETRHVIYIKFVQITSHCGDYSFTPTKPKVSYLPQLYSQAAKSPILGIFRRLWLYYIYFNTELQPGSTVLSHSPETTVWPVARWSCRTSHVYCACSAGVNPHQLWACPDEQTLSGRWCCHTESHYAPQNPENI